ncbi:protein-glutamate methylesterase/protein-glutamine glutaminase [Desulfonatronovibrio hydrogenovorans]|uniref:protein-glutamate methylesterase/protein-glutamine glutaminase n=1 Tax=Desulfonatronovibrio hydrogenovorans TaxID=53245 RepID=UPI00048EC86C|nr:chemotaxis response regulator protein-glutamate methylesterase [Desulfonatronovibrio hydrogenovorans]
MIKVVVVDDSAFMRKAISTMLKKDPGIEVVGIARNGQEGLDMVRKLDPDVVTMDIEMPVMDGLTALRHIMMEMPRPVIMVSSLTTEGAEATLKAMDYGAVDFISKQLSKVSLDIVKIEKDLQSKVRAVARKRTQMTRLAALQRPRKFKKPVKEITPASGRLIRDIVAIGVSTGGPPAVQKVLSDLPENFPGSILVAQHMPGAFTGPFAKRLNDSTGLNVKEAENGDQIRPGWVYIAPGGSHLKINQKVSRIDVLVSSEPADALYKPSVNVLFSSVADGVGKRALGVVLTGMGSDGLLGARDLKARGGLLLAQSEDSCVVYGMPKAVVEDGLVDQVVDLEDMSVMINACLYESNIQQAG